MGEGSNEEMNIKRRIYDSLNVLLSMEVVRKEGGRISFCPPAEETHPYHEWLRLRQQQVLMKLRRRELKQKVEEARLKERGISRLMERNRRRLDGDRGKVPFPLIGMQLRPGWKVVSEERGR